MKLKFPPHFQDRIVERGIEIDDVKKALRSPDSVKTSFDDRKVARKKIGRKTIEVVYFKETFRDKREEYIIITAYYL